MTEVWQPVPGWTGFYSISNLGRVKSHRRVVMRSNGREYTAQARVLRAYRRPGRAATTVWLTRPGEHQRVDPARLAAELFGGGR
jgi:hypothetical protein